MDAVNGTAAPAATPKSKKPTKPKAAPAAPATKPKTGKAKGKASGKPKAKPKPAPAKSKKGKKSADDEPSYGPGLHRRIIAIRAYPEEGGAAGVVGGDSPESQRWLVMPPPTMTSQGRMPLSQVAQRLAAAHPAGFLGGMPPTLTRRLAVELRAMLLHAVHPQGSSPPSPVGDADADSILRECLAYAATARFLIAELRQQASQCA